MSGERQNAQLLLRLAQRIEPEIFRVVARYEQDDELLWERAYFYARVTILGWAFMWAMIPYRAALRQKEDPAN